jgi:hypothetical protein
LPSLVTSETSNNSKSIIGSPNISLTDFFSQFAEALFRRGKQLSFIFSILEAPSVASTSSPDLHGDYSWNSGIAIHWIVLPERSIPSATSSGHLSIMNNCSVRQYVHEIVPSPS